MQPFEYIEAQSVEEAVALLAAHPEDAQIIAGGTDLLSEIKDGIATPRRLISLSGIPALHAILDTGQGLAIGAMATIAQVAEHPARLRPSQLGKVRVALLRHDAAAGGELLVEPHKAKLV